MFALQFAKLHGATVIVTSSSEERLAKAKALGADYGIDYRQSPNWDQVVLELSNGRGADHVVDVGGATTLNCSVSALRLGGQISMVGLLSGASVEKFEVIPAFMKQARIQGINVSSREMFERMNRAITQSKLRPVIDHVFPFERAMDAFQYLSQGSHFGKICIQMKA